MSLRPLRAFLASALTPRNTFFVALPALIALTAIPAGAQPPGPGNPFAPPRAKVFYAPDRDYDLKHVAVALTVDWPARRFTGQSSSRLSPLRASGLTQVRLMCGESLTVNSVEVDGKAAKYARDGKMMTVDLPSQLAQGKDTTVTIRYTSGNFNGAGFGGGEGGFHWIATNPSDPTRVGFWTQGETDGNSNWAPTWDYPNDFATSETTTTVPADWAVVGNGIKVSDTEDKKAGTRTVHWKMEQPHATYLISLVGGPFDMKTAKWEDKPLLYVVPKGQGNLIDASFSDTPDMLTFFSEITGTKYPWPKYAQNAMYDFGGGMENVSASTLGANALTDFREGYRNMASLNSHELAHQWFGDYVTCRDWGQVWLNESFATFFQILYFEHSRGKNGYDYEIRDATRSYLREAERYQRPIVTNLYADPDVMFDSHTYPKGGTVLHTLRRQLGDQAFFDSIKLYLKTNAHRPVVTSDLIRAFTDASGVNVQPFFDQWIYKPGHPVLAYTWTYDEAKGELSVTVKQTQDTSKGTPVYTIPAKVGVVVNGTLVRLPITLNAATQTATFKTARPNAVLLDPDQDFLREIPEQPWSAVELPYIVRYAPVGADRTAALQRMLKEAPSDANIKIAIDAIAADTGQFPSFETIAPLVALKSEAARPLFRQQLNHPDFDRRTQAVQGLGNLAPDPQDSAALRAMITPTAPTAPAVAAIAVLQKWNGKASTADFKTATQIDSRGEVIRGAGYEALARTDPAAATPLLLNAAASTDKPGVQQAAIRAMGSLPLGDARVTQALRTALKSENQALLLTAVQSVAQRNEKALLPDLKALQGREAGRGFMRGILQQTIDRLEQ